MKQGDKTSLMLCYKNSQFSQDLKMFTSFINKFQHKLPVRFCLSSQIWEYGVSLNHLRHLLGRKE